MMDNLARLPIASGGPQLGPAEVVADETTSLRIRLKSGATVPAQLALAFGYRPTVGDSVLTIGNDDGFFIIGVLMARQEARLEFAGDVSLTASGKLKLRGMGGVELEGPEVSVRAGKLEMMARSVTQRYDRVKQRVVELLSVQAGQTHTVVDGSSYTRAENVTMRTKEKVSINGKSIHLG